MTIRFALLAAASLVSTAPALAQDAFTGTETVGETTLEATTGRADVDQLTQADLKANVSNNSVNGVSTTGTIGFDDQAFQNLSGLSVINANTGNNVAINASMNVNIAINPGQ